MNHMYLIDNGVVYLSAYASIDLIQWAQKMCELKGYTIVYVMREVV